MATSYYTKNLTKVKFQSERKENFVCLHNGQDC